MKVSAHSNGATTLSEHKFQIEAINDLGAEILVIHRNELCSPGTDNPNFDLIHEIIEFADSCNVRLAMENLLSRNELLLLNQILSKVPRLGICMDISHAYFTPIPLENYLEELKGRIIHVHLQDTRPESEALIPWSDRNNCIPGTG